MSSNFPQLYGQLDISLVEKNVFAAIIITARVVLALPKHIDGL